MTNVSDFFRDKVSEVELDMSETWSETRKYSSGLVRSGPVRSGRVALVEFGLNSAVDYSISLKFCTEFKRMTPEEL